MQVSRFNLLENYVDPIIYNPTVVKAVYAIDKTVTFIVAEIMKIWAAKMFLGFLANQIVSRKEFKISPQNVFNRVVEIPLIEEILATGILLQGIHLIQHAWNVSRGNQPLKEEDRKTQIVFRVHLAAIVFAGFHLYYNHHLSFSRALLQFAWTYWGGVIRGYLSEKYETLSLGIAMHGINNSLYWIPRVYKPSWSIPFPFESSAYLITNIDIIVVTALLANRVIAYLATFNKKKVP